MSKEQTPIEELRLEIIKHLPNNPDAVFDIMSKANKVTQTKVLETLEMEVVKSWVESVKESFRQEGRVCDNEFLGLAKNDAVKYYETEVKPKYKQINK